MKASYNLDTTFNAYRVEAKERKRSKSMEGYVQNEGRDAYFVLQRQVPPGGKVRLTDAYKSVGKKSGLEEDLEFVRWLRANILTRGAWGFYDEEGLPLVIEPKKEETVEVNTVDVVEPKAEARKKAKPRAKKSTSSKTSSKRMNDAKGAGRILRKEANEEKGTKVTANRIIEEPYEQARFLIDSTTDRAVLKKALHLSKHFAGKEKHMRHLIVRLEQVY